MFFKKVLITFFIVFSTLMLFIFVVRLANHKTGFLGLSDLLSYFEDSKIDFYEPLKSFSNDIGGIVRDFSSYIKNIQINNPWDTFVVAVNLLAKGFKMLSIPIVASFDLFKMIVGYISIFANFINWLISFEGYISPTPI